MTNSISAVILTKNEGRNIGGCIGSLKFCSEIVVIDDHSSDDTAEIAKQAGAKVFIRKLNEDFASQRNFGLEKAQSNWILFIDADELVSPTLASEIVQAVNNPELKYDGFLLKRQDTLLGKKLKHGEFWTNSFLRLAKKGAGKWKREVHEYWEVKGKIGRINSPILHNSHQNLKEFIADVNWYSSLHSDANHKEGKKSNLFNIVLYPKVKFLNNWVIKGGLLDGTEGFVAALIMSFHSFLAWSKLWIKQNQS